MAREIAPWEQAYLDRIERGLEACRHCGALPPATIVIARIRAGSVFSRGNVTILCSRHANAYVEGRDARPVTWRDELLSLDREERLRPPEERWAELADAAAAEAQGVQTARCALCERVRALDFSGRFVDHTAAGARPQFNRRGTLRISAEDTCPGSRQRPEFAEAELRRTLEAVQREWS